MRVGAPVAPPFLVQSPAEPGMFAPSHIAMHWIAPSENEPAAGQFRANSGLRGETYSGDATRELSIHGSETTDETGRLCRMNLH